MIRPVLLLSLFVVLATALVVVLFQLGKETVIDPSFQGTLVGSETTVTVHPEPSKDQTALPSTMKRSEGTEEPLIKGNGSERLRGEFDALIVAIKDGNDQPSGVDLRKALSEVITAQESVSKLTKKWRETTLRAPEVAEELRPVLVQSQDEAIAKYAKFFRNVVKGRRGALLVKELGILGRAELALLEGKPVAHMAMAIDTMTRNSVSSAIENQEKALEIMNSSFEIMRHATPMTPEGSLESEQGVLHAMRHESGQKMAEGFLKNGERDGLWTAWDPNGQKVVEGTYKYGKLDGLKTSWRENGQKMAEETYKDGEVVSAKYWNSKGEEVETWLEAAE